MLALFVSLVLFLNAAYRRLYWVVFHLLQHQLLLSKVVVDVLRDIATRRTSQQTHTMLDRHPTGTQLHTHSLR